MLAAGWDGVEDFVSVTQFYKCVAMKTGILS